MPRLINLEYGDNYDFYNRAIIGTDESCDIMIIGENENLKTISGRHAEIFEDRGIFYLVDLESKEGTRRQAYGANFIMSRKLTPYDPVELKIGNEVLLGKYRLRFVE